LAVNKIMKLNKKTSHINLFAGNVLLQRQCFGTRQGRGFGFALDDQEQRDGRFNRLEVKVNTREEKGKERKLEVNARRGYYTPKK
jgi:hypothetical protein